MACTSKYYFANTSLSDLETDRKNYLSCASVDHNTVALALTFIVRTHTNREFLVLEINNDLLLLSKHIYISCPEESCERCNQVMTPI